MFTIDYDGNLSDGHVYADRVDGTPITSYLLGVDPDALAVSPMANGGTTTLAVAGYLGNVGVYTFNGSTFSTSSIMTTASDAKSWGIAFSHDGQLLASGADDGQVRFWSAPFTTNATSGTSLAINGVNAANDIAFAPGAPYVAIAFDSEVDLWNVSTRAFVARRHLRRGLGCHRLAAGGVGRLLGVAATRCSRARSTAARSRSAVD